MVAPRREVWLPQSPFGVKLALPMFSELAPASSTVERDLKAV